MNLVAAGLPRMTGMKRRHLVLQTANYVILGFQLFGQIEFFVRMVSIDPGYFGSELLKLLIGGSHLRLQGCNQGLIVGSAVVVLMLGDIHKVKGLSM